MKQNRRILLLFLPLVGEGLLILLLLLRLLFRFWGPIKP